MSNVALFGAGVECLATAPDPARNALALQGLRLLARGSSGGHRHALVEPGVAAGPVLAVAGVPSGLCGPDQALDASGSRREAHRRWLGAEVGVDGRTTASVTPTMPTGGRARSCADLCHQPEP